MQKHMGLEIKMNIITLDVVQGSIQDVRKMLEPVSRKNSPTFVGRISKSLIIGVMLHTIRGKTVAELKPYKSRIVTIM